MTVNVTVPIKVKEPVPVCCQTCAWTGPTDSPGMLGVIAVACVGNGTVKVVLPVRAVARACDDHARAPHEVHHRQPEAEVREPVARNREAGRRASRSTGFGMMALTTGRAGVSDREGGCADQAVMCSRPSVATPAPDRPGGEPGMFGVIAVACVGNGTVRSCAPSWPWPALARARWCSARSSPSAARSPGSRTRCP